MKNILIPLLFITAFAGFLFAQGWAWSGSGGPPKLFPRNKPPPLSLSEAYAVAIAFVGAATNQFWCSGAHCPPDYAATNYVTHWEFGFSNTNGELRRVFVFFETGAYK